ncbi:MAG: thioredoxin family protein [Candidatus Saccharimonadales bacterium]
MNKRVWVVVVAIVLLIAAAVAYALVASQQNQQPQTPQKQETSTPDPQQPAQQAGAYKTYSEADFSKTEGRRILFFHAAWCPQCRQLEQSIEQQGVPSGMTIFKVDYDSSNELKQKYGVTLQTTVVEVDAQGNLVKKFVAYDDPSLNTVLDALGR